MDKLCVKISSVKHPIRHRVLFFAILLIAKLKFMQNTTGSKRPKDLTIVEEAIANVDNFPDLYQRLEKDFVINGKSESTFNNYSRHLAHIALFFNTNPLYLTSDQVTDYLFLKKKSATVSQSFFLLTVYAMRAACRLHDLPYKQFRLPKIPHEKKLPVVLNTSESKALMAAAASFNKMYGLIVALMIDCGLRISEVPSLELSHIDLERNTLHVHRSKRLKDRVIPIGAGVASRLKAHLEYWNPKKYVFESIYKSGTPISIPIISSIIKKAVATAKINKPVTAHTLRHCFGTILVENNTPLPVVQQYMGHSAIKTTMIYLQLVSMPVGKVISPVDLIYNLS